MKRCHTGQFWRSGILRKILLLLVLGFLVPVLLVVFFFLDRLYEDMNRQAIASYQSVNQQILLNVQSVLDGAEKYTAYPYYNTDFQSFLHKNYASPQGNRAITTDTRLYKQYIQEQILRYNTHISSAILYNVTSGTFFTGGYYYSASVMAQIAETLGGLEHADAAHSNIFLLCADAPDSQTLVLIARPVFDTSTRRYLGYFCLVVDARQFQAVLDSDTPAGVEQYIVDGQGVVVYCQDDAKIGKLSAPFIRKFSAGTAPYEQTKQDGRTVMLLQSTLAHLDWRAVSMVETGQVFYDAKQKQLRMSLVVAILFAVSVLAAVGVAVSISRPINRLKVATERMVNERFEMRVPVTSHDEVGDLARSFNRMLEEIEQLIQQVIEREQEKQAAEINTLQAQINPHFLYNTLNTIKWMANMQCADNISDATDSLIYLLRYASAFGTKFVCVRDEYHFVQRYLSLMQLRYCDSFSVQCDFSEEALSCECLRFLLQPFVENAIFHGFRKRNRQNLLELSAHCAGDTLVFHIKDNGCGMTQQTVAAVLGGAVKKAEGFNSIGVHNVIERIRLNYGEAYTVAIDSAPEHGTDVRITIPLIRTESTPLPE